MRARTRDFIYTTDNLFFATTNYLHPPDRILSFLRYIPHPQGERFLDEIRYHKVDSNEAYEFLKDNFPEYIYECDFNKVEMMGVPLNKVDHILEPSKRLADILINEDNDPLLEKVVCLANTFHDEADIPYSQMGISGSILPGLYDPKVSDIDFVIYGLKNHRKAMDTFREMKNHEDSILRNIDESYWKRIFKKRIKDNTLSFNEFKWYEERKNNRGLIEGTLFDILATREWDEIKGKYGQIYYEPQGTMDVECTVIDSLAAFDNPAVYKVEDVKVIKGPNIEIEELVSFTHTYAGQAKDGERVIARGRLEKVVGDDINYRLVVGTTREALGEYIKLKKRPIY